MNSKHLSTGSVCPAFSDNIRIYNMRFCPYAQRAILVAIAKDIPHEIVNCDLKNKPEWLLEKNCHGKVPVLEYPDGRVLYESLIVSDYLDEEYGGRQLTATNSFRKAEDKLLIEEFNQVINIFYQMFQDIKSTNMTALKQHLEDFQGSLSIFEKTLATRKTPFFGGTEPGMTDYMIWPWVERLPVFKLFTSSHEGLFDFEAAKKRHPKLDEWRKNMKEDNAVKAYYIPPEVHKNFLDSYLNGKPNYDIMASM